MAYWDLMTLAYDGDFNYRVAACASTQGEGNPEEWAANYRWEVASAPTFSDKYASALAGGVERPGRDQAVINDDEILASVQAVLSNIGGTASG